MGAAGGGSTITTQKVQLQQGYTVLPVMENAVKLQDMDYYRNGKAGKAETTTRTSGEGVKSNYTEFKDGYTARTLDPFPDAPASIRVFGALTGKAATKNKAKNKEVDLIPAYTKFILNGSQEGHQERVQIVETFSDFYVFFYGERPPIYTFSGVLINSRNANWVADFMYYYEEQLRGTKCAENNARIILTYGGRQIEGYILSMSSSTNADTEQGVPISFQVVITKRNRVGFSDDFGLGVENGQLKEDETLRKMIESIAGATGKGTSNPETSRAYIAAKTVSESSHAAAGPAFGDMLM